MLKQSLAIDPGFAGGDDHQPWRCPDRGGVHAHRRLRLHREAFSARALSRNRRARGREARVWSSRIAACAHPSRSRRWSLASSGPRRKIEELRATVAELAAVDASVIIYGETGSGKDLIARCLHDFGPRAKENYVALNCAAVPETMAESELFGHEAGAFTHALKTRIGKFEHANRGTLFLDEIDSMPLPLQGKLLRALQDRIVEKLGSNTAVAVNVRPIASSKIDLRAAGEKGTFRSDLYFRLATVELAMSAAARAARRYPAAVRTFRAAGGRAAKPAAEAGAIGDPARGADGASLAGECARGLRNAAERYVLGLPGAPLLPGQARPSAPNRSPSRSRRMSAASSSARSPRPTATSPR